MDGLAVGRNIFGVKSFCLFHNLKEEERREGKRRKRRSNPKDRNVDEFETPEPWRKTPDP